MEASTSTSTTDPSYTEFVALVSDGSNIEPNFSLNISELNGLEVDSLLEQITSEVM